MRCGFVRYCISSKRRLPVSRLTRVLFSPNSNLVPRALFPPHLQSQRKAPWGRSCPNSPQMSLPHNFCSIRKSRTDRRLVAEPLNSLQQNYSQVILSSGHHLSARGVKNSVFRIEVGRILGNLNQGNKFQRNCSHFAFTYYVGYELKTLLEDT